MRKANWNEEEITLVIKMAREVQEERVTTSISMQMSLWRLGLCELILGRGVLFVKLLGFIWFTPGGGGHSVLE